jgi:acetylserotonin N-methyltransferase
MTHADDGDGYAERALAVTDPRPIWRYRDGMYAADLLTAAIAWLDFFSWLAEHPSDKLSICAQFGTHERPTDVMLTLFTAMGLVARRRGVFHATELAREHLVRTSPFFIGPYFAALRDRPVCRDFVEVLRTDRVARWAGVEGADDWHEAMNGADFATRFTAAMDCRGVLLGRALARSLDLRGRRRLLDIAGGSGIYACELAFANPHLDACVLEKAPVDAVAATAIAARGCATRVSVVEGDMFETGWPDDADVHLFSNVLHDWPETVVRDLLRRSFVALRPGGMVVVHDAFISTEKDGPLPVAEYSALLMHSTQGKCHSIGEYASMLTDAGFVEAEYAETVADRGRMTARKPVRAP